MTKVRQIAVILLTVIAMFPVVGHAQEDADFKMEIGGGLGGGFYLGDFNNTMFTNMQPAVGAYWRYLFDHYNSLKVNLTYCGIKGSTDDHDSFYPEDPYSGTISENPLKHKFSGSIIDMSCLYEINLWPYGYYEDFFGHKRLTPFLQLGVGFSYASKAKGVAFGIPIGAGIKYRISRRFNVSFDWTMHFTMSDKLDGTEAPLGITSSGFKNKDHFSVAMFTLTYSFAPRCQTCNKN